jgi:hypothetical protein
VANVQAIRKALAAQLQAELHITCKANVPPVITPPMVMVIPSPGQYIQYGVTMGESTDALAAKYSVMGEVMGDISNPMSKNNIMLTVLICLSTAQGYEAMQPALDALLEPAGNSGSVPDAIALDETLGGAVDFAIPLNVSGYGLVNIANQDYFGAHIQVQVGA